MELNIPPAQSGAFSYNGSLLVDPGNGKHYRRSTPLELSSLFKAAPAGSKDETAHFYEAQLVHYGLQRTKDKARAKSRLLDALNGSELTVNAGVSAVEASLKKEYASAKRKAKASAGGEASSSPARNQPSAKQKKITDANLAALCSPSVSKPNSKPSAAMVSKTASTTLKKRKMSEIDQKAPTKPAKAAKTDKPKAKPIGTKQKAVAQVPQVTITNNVYVSGARTAAKATSPNKAASVKTSPAKVTPAKAHPAKGAPAKATPAKRSPQKATPTKSTTSQPGKPTSTPASKPQPHKQPLLEGLFDLHLLPHALNTHGPGTALLRLLNPSTLDAFSKRGHLWGEFDFHYCTGVFKATPVASSTARSSSDPIELRLEWRGRRASDAGLSCAYAANNAHGTGEDNLLGRLELDVHGRVSGHLAEVWGSEVVQFEGTLRGVSEGPQMKERSKGSFETQWRKYRHPASAASVKREPKQERVKQEIDGGEAYDISGPLKKEESPMRSRSDVGFHDHPAHEHFEQMRQMGWDAEGHVEMFDDY